MASADAVVEAQVRESVQGRGRKRDGGSEGEGKDGSAGAERTGCLGRSSIAATPACVTASR